MKFGGKQRGRHFYQMNQNNNLNDRETSNNTSRSLQPNYGRSKVNVSNIMKTAQFAQYYPNVNQRSSLNVGLNKYSPSKNFHKRNLGDQNYLMKSKISQISGVSRLQENGVQKELFPQQLIFLLSNEQSNIEYFKDKIEKQKQKVQKEFIHFKQQLDHLLNDLLLSIMAELDLVYKEFMSQYADLKTQVSMFRKLRNNVLANLQRSGQRIENPNFSKLSNLNVLQQIQRDAEMIQNQKIYQQISQLQKQKMHPIMQLVDKLVIQGAAQKQYFQQSALSSLFSNLKSLMSTQIRMDGFKDLNNIVYSCSRMVELQNKQRQENNMVLKGFENSQRSLSQRNEQLYRPQNINKHAYNNKPIFNSSHNQYGIANHGIHQQYKNFQKESFNLNQLQQKQVQLRANQKNGNLGYRINVNENSRQSPYKQYQIKNPFSGVNAEIQHDFDQRNNKFISNEERRYQHIHSLDTQRRPYSQPKTVKGSLKDPQVNRFKMQETQRNNYSSKKPSEFTVSSDQQSLVSSWAQELYFNLDSRIEVRAAQKLLCAIFVKNGKEIAVGSKDQNIYIYNIEQNKQIVRLIGHNASVCCMSLLHGGQVLASGGDYKCNSVILWDTKSWTIKQRLQIHSAAVTSILDFQDDQNLASAGYDKKINVFNYKKNIKEKLVQEKQMNPIEAKTAISGLVMSADKSKIIATGLNKTILVYRVKRSSSNGFQGLELYQQIVCEDLISAIRTVQLAKDLLIAGTKGGKLHLMNVHNGKTIKIIDLKSKSIIQILAFERESNPYFPLILTCGSKQSDLKLTKPDIELVQSKYLNAKLFVDHGCGIGPKIVISSQRKLAIVNHSDINKQIVIYNIDIK